MIDPEIREKAIEESRTSPWTDLGVWLKGLLFISMPLGLLSIMFGHIIIRQHDKINNHSTLTKDEKKKSLISLGIINLLISIVILSIGIILHVILKNWIGILLLYLLVGLAVSWFCISIFENYANKKIHKFHMKQDAYLQNQLEKQEVPRLRRHPVYNTFEFCFIYKYWLHLEEARYESKQQDSNPVTWKNGVIVNKAQGVMFPIDVWNMHCLMMGSSGYGKTYNILKYVFDGAYNQFPIWFLDGKADPKLEIWLRRIAKLFNMNITVWNLNRKVKYNPFAHKTRIGLIDMVSEIFDYTLKAGDASTNLYAGYTRDWITTVIDFLLGTNQIISFKTLAYFTKPGQLVDYLTSEPIHKNDYFDKDEMLSEIAELETTQLKIMHTTLKEMYSNSKEVISDDGFALKDFMRAAKRGSIVLFQLANNITNHNIEKLLLQDWMMMQHFNETEREFDKKKTLLVIDEAAAIFRNRDQPTEMAQQFRSKQIALCFGFQEKSGLEKGDKIGLLDTLINNSTTYFISRLKDESTLKAVAAIHGTKKHVMPTMQTTYGPDGTRIQGEAESLRIDETMVWHPNEIRKLEEGEVMFSTRIQQVENEYPNYKVKRKDVIYNKLLADNILDTIKEFEEKKIAAIKDNKIKLIEPQDPISVATLKLIWRLESDESYVDVYRKQLWNTKKQKEHLDVDMPADFLSDITAHIHELQMQG